MSTDFSDISRRGFLRAAAAPATAGVLGYAWAMEPHWCEVVRRDMPIAGLPPQWHGRTLLQLSDLHIGAADDAYLVASLERASDLAADLVVVTGDFVSYHGPEQFEQADRMFASIRRPPRGIFGSFGNHDYGPT